MDTSLPSNSKSEEGRLLRKRSKVWTNPKILRQIGYCGVATTGFMVQAMLYTYPGILLEQWNGENEVNLTMREAQHFASLTSLSAIPAGLIAGTVQEMAGPRRVLLFVLPLLAISYVTTYLCAYYKSLLILLRTVQGILDPFLEGALHVFICEIPDEYVRGVAAPFYTAGFNLAILLTYAILTVLPWKYGGYILFLFSIPSIVGIFLSPESPSWLARNGKLQESLNVAMTIRCDVEDARSELLFEESRGKGENRTSFLTLIRLAVTPKYLIPIIVSILMLVLRDAVGYFAFVTFSLQIMEGTNSQMSPYELTTMIWSVRILSNLVAIPLFARFSRRFLFAVTSGVASLSTLGLSIYLYLQVVGYNITLNYLPVLFLAVYTIFNALGTNSISTLLSTEILPTPVRNIGSALSVMASNVTCWVVLYTFEPLRKFYGLHLMFFLYSLPGFAIVALCAFVLPETKNKPLLEIENHWIKMTRTMCK